MDGLRGAWNHFWTWRWNNSIRSTKDAESPLVEGKSEYIMSNLIGQSLGRYHILEQLGEGGMAVVYKAYDTRLERNVAIKVILPQKQHTDKFIKRFEREAKSLAQLSHPNIVNVIDYGEHEGLPYLVMEYLPGGTLKQKISGKPMSWQESIRLLIPIARALAYAHEHKIVHRDVKPGNILITGSGEPILSDFGIAKILEAEETMDLTGTGVGVGTPEYMSPEQAQGASIDARSDVYSLGVVLYEMVTGRRPFQADTPMAVIWKLVSAPLPRPKQFAADLPQTVENVLLKALAKSPVDRYQTMSGFAIILENMISGNLEKEKISKSTRWVSGQGFRHFLLWIIAVVICLSLIGIFIGKIPFNGTTGFTRSSTPVTQNTPEHTNETNSQIKTLTSTPDSRPTLFVTKLPTSTDVMILTSTVLANEQVGYYDDFQNQIYDTAYNSELWTINSGSAKAIQKDGMLILSDLAPTSGDGMILTLNGWKRPVFSQFEVRIKVNTLNGANGNITINLTSSTIPGGWKEFGIGSDSNGTKIFVSSGSGNMAEINAKKDIWYKLRVVFDRDNNILKFFVDGEPLTIYKIPGNVAKLTPSIQFWHPSGDYFSGSIDDIRIEN